MATKLQKEWEEKITAAKKAHGEWKDKFKIDLGRAYFEGDQNPGHPDLEWITVNKIYTHLQAQLPALYSLDPYFYVKVKKSFKIDPEAIVQMEAKGKKRQAMLNYLKVELKLKRKARLAIQDAHFAFGVLKARRASELKEHPQAGEQIVDEDNNPVLDPETGEPQVFPDEIPVNERYELLRVHPDDFVWDADAGPLEDDWSFLAQRMRMTKKKARKDKRFKKADIDQIQGKKPGTDDTRSTVSKVFESFTGNKESDDNDIIDLWEIYDLEERQWLIIAEGAERPLLKPRPTAPGIEKHPYGILRFTLRDKSPYPIPPVSPALGPQFELSLSRSRRLTHMKRFNRKYIIDETKFDDPELAVSQLESGGDGTIIRAIQVAGAIEAIQDAPMDQQNLLHDQQLERDLVEVFGSPGAARGIADADSASEAVLLDKHMEVREGDRLSIVSEMITDIAAKLDMLVQFHIDKDEAVKIIGPDTGGPDANKDGSSWIVVKETDYEAIQGEFEYSVNMGASQPRLPDVERAQWIAFLSQVVVPLPHILTNPSLMRRMAEMFHIEDEAALEELRQMGEKMLSGETPMPGGQGGGPSNNPIAEVLGQAGGPGGGNNNGGGSQL